jgi:hypothetical protein
MAYFEVSRAVGLSPQDSWRRVTDWPEHRVPLTRVRVRGGGPQQVGAIVVARTGVGPLGFEDPMEIVAWEPPDASGEGRCRLEKRGRLVLGWAEIRVGPAGPGSVVHWREELGCAGLPGVADPLLSSVARLTFGRTLDRLLATGTPGPPPPSARR